MSPPHPASGAASSGCPQSPAVLLSPATKPPSAPATFPHRLTCRIRFSTTPRTTLGDLPWRDPCQPGFLGARHGGSRPSHLAPPPPLPDPVLHCPKNRTKRPSLARSLPTWVSKSSPWQFPPSSPPPPPSPSLARTPIPGLLFLHCSRAQESSLQASPPPPQPLGPALPPSQAHLQPPIHRQLLTINGLLSATNSLFLQSLSPDPKPRH